MSALLSHVVLMALSRDATRVGAAQAVRIALDARAPHRTPTGAQVSPGWFSMPIPVAVERRSRRSTSRLPGLRATSVATRVDSLTRGRGDSRLTLRFTQLVS